LVGGVGWVCLSGDANEKNWSVRVQGAGTGGSCGDVNPGAVWGSTRLENAVTGGAQKERGGGMAGRRTSATGAS